MTGAGPDPGAELRRYRALFEHAPDAIVILDAGAGRFVTANAAAERLFGRTRAQLRTLGPAEVSPPTQPDGRASATAAAAHVAAAAAGEVPRFAWTHRRADGTDLPCEVTLLRLPDPERVLVRGSVLDLTERLAAEQARRDAASEHAARRAAEAAAARLNALVAGLAAILWEADVATWEFSYVSDRAEEILGHPVARWLGDPGFWPSIIHPDDREAAVQLCTDRIAAGETDYEFSYRALAADGRTVWLHDVVHVVRDPDGTPRQLQGMLLDVTDERRAREASALLADAGRALADDDLEPALHRVARRALGVLGDAVIVSLLGDDGRLRHVATAHADPDLEPLLGPAADDAPPPAVFAAEATGAAVVVVEITDAIRRASARDADQYAMRARLGSRTALLAPLTARGTVLGLVTLASRDPRRDYTRDVGTAEELARRVAAAVDAHRARDRMRRLHAVTAALASAATVAAAAGALAAEVAAAFDTDRIGVYRLTAARRLRLVHLAGYPDDPAVDRLVDVAPDDDLPVSVCVRTGEPVWIENRAEFVARHPGLADTLDRTGTEAVGVLPMVVAGRVTGALLLGFARPKVFRPDQRELAAAFAAQAAQALERAAAADSRREVAEVLQHSLLPHRLPTLPRLALAARYVPGAEGVQTGGDWYDVLHLDDGRIALVVGDIVGQGAPAAAAMGQVRSALAMALMVGGSPARALERLDAFAARTAGGPASSAACLVLDPATGVLVHSSAGHPPPLVVEDGPARFLDGGHGPVLGILRAPRREARTVLRPGTMLLLYTDGLVERRGEPIDEGLARLAAAAAAGSGTAPDAFLDGVLDPAPAGTRPADDIAVVAARYLPVPLDLRIPARAEGLRPLRVRIAEWAAAAGLDPDTVDDLQLVVGEAVSNGVEHAYRDAHEPGEVRVRLAGDPAGGVAVTVADTGTWRPVPEDNGYRGRGLQVLRAIGTDLAVHEGTPGSGGTVVRVRVPRAAGPPAPSVRRPEPAPARAAVVRPGTRGARALVAVSGDLDLSGAAEARPALLAALAGTRAAVLDLTDLGHVTSAGVGLLLEAAAAAAGPLAVVLPPAGAARRIIDLTGLVAALERGGAADPAPAGRAPG